MIKIDTILNHINNLPPFNQTIVKLIEFAKQQEQSADQLAIVLKEDPCLVANLLKTANSALFGFGNKFETIENIINILGINFTLSIALGSSIQSQFDMNLKPYGSDMYKYKIKSYLVMHILNNWIEGSSAYGVESWESPSTITTSAISTPFFL